MPVICNYLSEFGQKFTVGAYLSENFNFLLPVPPTFYFFSSHYAATGGRSLLNPILFSLFLFSRNSYTFRPILFFLFSYFWSNFRALKSGSRVFSSPPGKVLKSDIAAGEFIGFGYRICLLYTSPSPRD